MKPAIIPGQQEGSKSDNTYSVACHSAASAIAVFRKASRHLLNVNGWERLSGKLSATFQLTDANGTPVERQAQVNDRIRIQLPGMDQHDWVVIESMQQQQQGFDEFISFKVRPANEPGNDQRCPHHFFTDNATSSFMVARKGNVVSASVHGRNELPNTEVKGLWNKLRNAAIAFFAILGLNTPQWKSLAKGIIKKE